MLTLFWEAQLDRKLHLSLSLMNRGAMARDPVPKAQEKIVIQRSGDRCAYPSCGIALSIDAKADEDPHKAVGKVAHIRAASVNGPRYDEHMTSEQRGSADNLVYLCGPHHDIVDTQLNYHTVEFLQGIKAKHERTVARAMSHAMGQVGFDDLELVCKFIGMGEERTSDEVIIPIGIKQKIELNSLGPISEERIRIGLAKSQEVDAFVSAIGKMRPTFGNQLAAHFKREYYGGFAEGLQGDDLFEYICSVALENAGPVETDKLRAATLATVAYLFQLCELFEHEHPAA
ncbi:ABC-three component system protein [Streptomyces sp. NPDC048410]|uniref:ABC-three component system protein n=1 Tax=Streptomyces sp. NPDC048410 TaxID=3365545 RepID=UPI0037218B2D